MRRTWQRALVTGASGGIGEAITRRLAAAGCDLVLVARSGDRLEALAAELAERHAVEAEVLVADLADRDQLAPVEARVAATDRPVDLLVNNAGYGLGGRFGDIPVDDADDEIQLNVVALMRLTHAAVTRMRAATGDQRGAVMLLSSVASFEPIPSLANYAATKAYVSSFGQALHEELRPDGILVTTVCPGMTATGFQARGGHDHSDAPDWVWQTADQVAAEALAGLDRGRALVTTGVVNKSIRVGALLVPPPVSRRVIGEVGRRRRA